MMERVRVNFGWRKKMKLGMMDNEAEEKYDK